MRKIAKIFGDRVAVRLVEEEFKGLLVPAPTTQRMYMLSEVVAVGEEAGVKSDIAVNDILFWQWNGYIEQHNAFMLNGERVFILSRLDMIARVKTRQVTLKDFEILGEWVLVKRTVEQPSKRIIVPDSVAETNQALVYRFHVEQKGPDVKVPVSIGQEVLVDRTRTNPLKIEDTDFGYLTGPCVLGALQ